MDLNFSRISEDEISVQLKNDVYEQSLSVVLRQDCDVLCFTCDIGLSVPNEKYMDVAEAIIRANERIWSGHFDLISASDRIVFSFTLPFISSISVDEDVISSAVRMITEECNKYHHYFAMLIENNYGYDFAVGALFIEAAGEA